MEIAQSLLPNTPLVRLENWQIDKISTQIILNVISTSALAYCPLCNQVSHRIHSHYERTLTDLPWGEYHQEFGSRKSEFGKQLFNSELRIPNSEFI